MSPVDKKTGRGPMIHIRLDRETHTNLKMIAAKEETTIQQIVENIIIHDVKIRLTGKKRGGEDTQ